MSKFPLSFERAYRLRPSPGALENHVSLLRIGGGTTSQSVLLPYSSGLGYFIVPTQGPVCSIEGKDFRAERLSLPLSLWVRLRLALLFKKKKHLDFAEFSLFCFGVKPERKHFTIFNQHLFNTGLALEGPLVTSHPELLQGWTPLEGAEARQGARFIARRGDRRSCLLRGRVARYRRRDPASEHALRLDRHHRSGT